MVSFLGVLYVFVAVVYDVFLLLNQQIAANTQHAHNMHTNTNHKIKNTVQMQTPRINANHNR